MTESDRLSLLYEMNQRLVDFHEIAPLVRFATQRVRELFEATGCALLVLDKSGEHFEFEVANQIAAAPSEAQLRVLRVPSSFGVAGRVLVTGQPEMLLNVQSRSDVFRGIDEATGQETRTLLCAPVVTRHRRIGVVEVVNAPAMRVTENDLQFLHAIAEDIAVAYEIAEWFESLQREADLGRRAWWLLSRSCVVGGILWCTLILIFGSVWSTQWTDSLSRPAFWFGVAAVAVGMLIARARRQSQSGIAHRE